MQPAPHDHGRRHAVSRSRAKGTTAETALMKWFRLNGFPGADRQPLRGNRDCGDLALCPGIVVEVKNHNGATGLGQPAAALLTRWMAEAARERDNAGAAYCPLVVKRAGTTDPGRWFAYITVSALASLTGGNAIRTTDSVCLTVATLAGLLRDAGYGATP